MKTCSGVAAAIAVFLVFLTILSGTAAGYAPSGGTGHFNAIQDDSIYNGSNTTGMPDQTMQLSVLVTFSLRNSAYLDTVLSGLQDPMSPEYHHFLSAGQFTSMFAPNPSEYAGYLSFFQSQGFYVNAYSGRLSMGLTGKLSLFQSVFHVQISTFRENGKSFYAPTTDAKISYGNSGEISAVTGLSNRFSATVAPLFTGSGSSETFFGSDMQAAYQLNALYRGSGYPVNETVATILWAGSNSGNQTVAPFNPSDVNYYFRQNMPSGEPLPKVYGYPILGAVPPGSSASSDVTNTNIESTLDIEMAGSTAPGASVIEVYGPQPSQFDLLSAFADILNPSYNTTVNAALSRVVAISNSWGSGTDVNIAGWNTYEKEAAARGITVLAATGDNGNTNGPAPSFPANSAFNSYGTVAVGGASMVLSGTPTSSGTGTTGISGQSVWYNSPYPGNGTEGGVSAVYAEPSWQVNSSDANGVITSSSSITHVASGRRIPDIAADAVSMQIYITLASGSGYATVYGTSIASPLVAGVVATMDNSLNSREGFMDPVIYKFGQAEYSGLYRADKPFYFISNGSNALFSAMNGYSLAVGWGSINALNFVADQIALVNSNRTYSVTVNETGLPAGDTWTFNVTGNLSYSTANTSMVIQLKNGSYGYSFSTPDKRYRPSGGGKFVLYGSPVRLNTTFSAVKNMATFLEIGLAPGIMWYLNFTGGANFSTSQQDIMLPLVNGTYNYSVSSGNRTWKPDSRKGTLAMSGFPESVPVNFSMVTYSVTFIETGLIHGTEWSLTMRAFTYTTAGSSITLNLSNGTRFYSVHPVRGYTLTGGNNTVVIAGNNTTVAVVFHNNGFSLSSILNSYTITGILSGIALAAIIIYPLRVWRRRKK